MAHWNVVWMEKEKLGWMALSSQHENVYAVAQIKHESCCPHINNKPVMFCLNWHENTKEEILHLIEEECQIARKTESRPNTNTITSSNTELLTEMNGIKLSGKSELEVCRWGKNKRKENKQDPWNPEQLPISFFDGQVSTNYISLTTASQCSDEG